jgi:hypothetical protein
MNHEAHEDHEGGPLNPGRANLFVADARILPPRIPFVPFVPFVVPSGFSTVRDAGSGAPPAT